MMHHTEGLHIHQAISKVASKGFFTTSGRRSARAATIGQTEKSTDFNPSFSYLASVQTHGSPTRSNPSLECAIKKRPSAPFLLVRFLAHVSAIPKNAKEQAVSGRHVFPSLPRSASLSFFHAAAMQIQFTTRKKASPSPTPYHLILAMSFPIGPVQRNELLPRTHWRPTVPNMAVLSFHMITRGDR